MNSPSDGHGIRWLICVWFDRDEVPKVGLLSRRTALVVQWSTSYMRRPLLSTLPIHPGDDHGDSVGHDIDTVRVSYMGADLSQTVVEVHHVGDHV